MMKPLKKYITAAVAIVLCGATLAETDAEKAQRMKWWTDARFGMFIHFGLYAMPARGEWVRQRARIPVAPYDAKYQ